MPRNALSKLVSKVAKVPVPEAKKVRRRGARPLETSIENKVVKRAREELGLTLCRKLNGAGARSWPDRMWLIPRKVFYAPARTGKYFQVERNREHRTVFIEFKRDKDSEVTKAQLEMHDDLRAAGFDVAVFWEVEPALAWLKSFL